MIERISNARIWVFTAVIAGTGVVVLSQVDGEVVDRPYEIPWWVIAAAFLFVDWQAIHLPTRKSTHTITLSEVPLMVGLAFLSPVVLVGARLLGSVIPLVLVRKQRRDRLAFNLGLTVLETSLAAFVFHVVRGGSTPAEPRGWMALFLASAVAASVGAYAVGLAIAMHDSERSLRSRSREIGIGIFISIAAGTLGILWTAATWDDPRISILIGLSLVPVFAALRRFEQLGRRHGELEIVFDLTKDLESCVSLEDVGKQAVGHVAELTRPAATVALFEDQEPMLYTAAPEETVHPSKGWPEMARIHLGRRDGPDCACAADVLGAGWKGSSSYPVIAGDGHVGLLIVRPRRAPGGELTGRDHRTLTAVASQISSAVSRIAALRRLEMEVEEKRALIHSKDQLIASVSHELRTPLTAILGFAEVLADDSVSFSEEDKTQATSFIAAEARDLGNIVEDLLTAARADLNTLVLQRKPIAIRNAVEQAAKALIDAGRLDIHGENWIALADPPRVRQILRNLFANASKYGGKRVVVLIGGDSDVVTVRVRDDGEGVPATRTEQIFDAYESAHEEPTQPGSLGLGLTISRTLAHLMQGNLTYQRVDDWTEFCLSLPVVDTSGV